MNAPPKLPDPSDKDTLLAWLQANRAKALGHAPVRSLSEFARAQHRRLLEALTAAGPPTLDDRNESSTAGERTTTASQSAVPSFAHARDHGSASDA
ncbi:hypothetical protein [Streptomyces sp. NPDC048445]|uniref:hypothetical protein n=1 Tax=Streptomyces sp. NPDC048445 TaxID=3365553 RepID=UPI0037147D66